MFDFSNYDSVLNCFVNIIYNRGIVYTALLYLMFENSLWLCNFLHIILCIVHDYALIPNVVYVYR